MNECILFYFVFLFCLEQVQAEINRGTCIVLGAHSFGEQPATHNTRVDVEQWQDQYHLFWVRAD
jgi:hypothetical protein